MIKLENTQVFGFEAAIRGMRNPMNSWDKSDSFESDLSYPESQVEDIFIGQNDEELMRKLNKGGPVHAKYRRMIEVWVDITAPLRFWKDFDTYRFGRERNSCSTMHKIQDKEFTPDDISHEHLLSDADAKRRGCIIPFGDNEKVFFLTPLDIYRLNMQMLNKARALYLDAVHDSNDTQKDYWWQMIELLPDSYNQRATIMVSYEVLASVYRDRINHKQDEWHTVCRWIEDLPYSWIITGKEAENNE